MKAECLGCQYDTQRRRERRMQRIARGKTKEAVKRTFEDGKAGLESGEENDDLTYMIDAVWATALSRVSKTAGQRLTLDEMGVDEGFIISLAQNAGNGLTPNLNHRGNVAASKTQINGNRRQTLSTNASSGPSNPRKSGFNARLELLEEYSAEDADFLDVD